MERLVVHPELYHVKLPVLLPIVAWALLPFNPEAQIEMPVCVVLRADGQRSFINPREWVVCHHCPHHDVLCVWRLDGPTR